MISPGLNVGAALRFAAQFPEEVASSNHTHAPVGSEWGMPRPRRSGSPVPAGSVLHLIPAFESLALLQFHELTNRPLVLRNGRIVGSDDLYSSDFHERASVGALLEVFVGVVKVLFLQLISCHFVVRTSGFCCRCVLFYGGGVPVIADVMSPTAPFTSPGIEFMSSFLCDSDGSESAGQYEKAFKLLFHGHEKRIPRMQWL